VMVPSAAIRTVAGTPRVFVVTGEGDHRRAEERVIATGQVDGDRTEVTSGVKPGERIVASGLENIVDGIAIAVTR